MDLQALQGGSRNRGLGRYSLYLAEAIYRARPEWERILLLHGGGAPAQLVALRKELSRRMPDARLVTFDAPWPWADGCDFRSVAGHAAAEAVREQLLDDLAPDMVLVLSLFEGYAESVVSISPRPGRISAVIGYDVLPLTDPMSRPEPSQQAVYRHRLESLRSADILLCISDYSAGEFATALGEPMPRSCTIWGAPVPLVPTVHPAARGVLCVGGDTPRKNERVTIKAYSRLPADLRHQHPLTVSGRRRDSEVAGLWRFALDLGLDDRDFRVSGAEVTDAELANQYASAALVVMPSLGEGLGLPVLEAWSLGTPAICSNTTSLGELVADAQFSFNPEDAEQQSALLFRCLSDNDFLARAAEHGKKRIAEFTWESTAERALVAMGQALGASQVESVGRPSLAMHTPWPPEDSGIARHAEVLLPDLEGHYEVTIVNDHPEAVAALRKRGTSVISTQAFLSRWREFDRILYNTGNNRKFHSRAIHALGLVPGVVIVHDPDLVGLVRGCEPPLPFNETATRLGEAGIRGLSDWSRSVGVDLMRTGCGVIVHSGFAGRHFTEDELVPLLPDRVAVAPLVQISQGSQERAVARGLLGIPTEAVLVCTFGRAVREKRVHVAWEAVANLRASGPDLVFRAVGGGDEDYAEWMRQRFGGDYGAVTGIVSDGEYSLWLSACDVAIQLRGVSRGETSGALVEALSFGAEVIAEDVGSFREFQAAGARLVPSPATPDDVAQVLAEVLDAGVRDSDPRRADLAAFRVRHSPQSVAARYAAAIEDFYRRPRSTSASLNDAQLGWVARNRFRLEATRGTIYWANPLGTSMRGAEWHTAAQLLRDAVVGNGRARVLPVRLDAGRPEIDLAELRLLLDAAHARDLDSFPDTVSVRDGDWLVLAQPNSGGHLQAPDLQEWRARGGKVAALVHDISQLEMEDLFPGPTGSFEHWLTAVADDTDVVVCPSAAITRRVEQWVQARLDGRQGTPVLCTVPCGCDVDLTLPPPDELRLRPVFSRRVLVVGDAGPVSAFPLVLGAVSRLRQTRPELELVLAGGGSLSDRVMLERESRAGAFQWLAEPTPAELRWEYLNADLVVLAGRGDGYGLPGVEGLAYGARVVARDLPQFRAALGAAASYFRLDGDLAAVIDHSLSTPRPRGAVAPLVTWADAASRFIAALGLAGAQAETR